ncbi:MAG: TPM domain-containing protein [Finegoldia magna]
MKLNKIKKMLIKVIVIVGAFLTMLNNYDQVFASSEDSKWYYEDNLNVLSKDTKDKINEANNNLDDNCEIFVLTVNNLEYDVKEYADKAFDKCGLESSIIKKDVLILLAKTSKGEQYLRIITSKGLEEILSDNKVNRIIEDKMMPSFENNKVDEGIANGFNEIYKIIEKSEKKEDERNKRNSYSIYLYLIIMPFMFFMLRDD